MSSIIHMVLDSNWADLSKYTEKRAADKIKDKIGSKKAECIDKINVGYDSVESAE